MERTERTELYLKIWLRICAAVMSLALAAVFLPTPWMARSHELLGLGPFPDGPVVQYLTRSLSLLYAVHGALFWVVSFAVRRLRPMIVFLGVSNVVFGAAMVGIDAFAGLPALWTWGEGLSVAANGLVLLVLVRQVPDCGVPRAERRET